MPLNDSQMQTMGNVMKAALKKRRTKPKKKEREEKFETKGKEKAEGE